MGAVEAGAEVVDEIDEIDEIDEPHEALAPDALDEPGESPDALPGP